MTNVDSQSQNLEIIMHFSFVTADLSLNGSSHYFNSTSKQLSLEEKLIEEMGRVGGGGGDAYISLF